MNIRTECLDKILQEGSLHVRNNGEGYHEEEPAESPAARSGMFTRLVSQIFDQASWITDPLEDSAHYMIDGDVGVAVSSSMSFSARQSESTQSQSPTRRHGDAKATHSRLLASHPSRQIFLSDCNDSGRILLWQYDGPRFLSLFTPMPYSDLRQLQSNTDVFSFSTKISRSKTLTSRMSNWGGAADISFSDNGERFAAIGDGGVVAVWRLSGGSARHSDVDGAFCSEWWNQVWQAFSLFFLAIGLSYFGVPSAHKYSCLSIFAVYYQTRKSNFVRWWKLCRCRCSWI